MGDEHQTVADELPLESVGAQLRREREGKGLSLPQVSAETRIPERHLILIEAGNFSDLPARTYAIGFSRTYARMLGLDEVAVADQVRAELSEADADRHYAPAGMEPGDPAKLPSRGLAWAGGIAAILLIAGMAAFYSTYYGSGAGPASLIDRSSPQVAENEAGEGAEETTAPAAASADGQVILTALEDMWVRIYDEQYDAGGEPLFEGTLASGDTYELPRNVAGPRINTGRPDALAITIDGQSVPKLADEPITLGDAQISAAALLARADQPSQSATPDS